MSRALTLWAQESDELKKETADVKCIFYLSPNTYYPSETQLMNRMSKSGKLIKIKLADPLIFINRVKEYAKTKAYRTSIKKRKTIESLFGEAKEQMGLRVCKFRRRWNTEEQFLLTATVQNIKRMVKLLNKNRKDAAANRIKSKDQTALPVGNAVFHSLLTYCRIALVFIRKYTFALDNEL